MKIRSSVEDNNSDDVKYIRLILNMYLILSGNNRSFPTWIDLFVP